MAFKPMIAAIFLLATVAACGGGDADVETTTNNTTVGQELLDLQAALQSGAITQDEYDEQREKILSR